MKPNKGDCLVFIEELGEKRSVPYANLNKFPSDQICRLTLPYTTTSYLQLCPQSQNKPRTIAFKKRYANRKSSTDNYKCLTGWCKKTKCLNIQEESIDYNTTAACKLKPYTSLCNYQLTPNNNPNIIAMPLLVDDASNNNNDKHKKTNNQQTTTSTMTTATVAAPTQNAQSLLKTINDKNNNNGKLNANKKDDTTKSMQKIDYPGKVSLANNKIDTATKSTSKDVQFTNDEYEMVQSVNDYAYVSSAPTMQAPNHPVAGGGGGGYLLYPRYDDMMFQAYGYEMSPPYQPMFYNGNHHPGAGPVTAMAANYMPTAAAMYHGAQENAAVNMMQPIPIFSPTASSINPSGPTPLMNGPTLGGIIGPTTPTSPTAMSGLLPIKRKDLLQSTNLINLYARPSYAMNCTDLPCKFNK